MCCSSRLCHQCLEETCVGTLSEQCSLQPLGDESVSIDPCMAAMIAARRLRWVSVGGLIRIKVPWSSGR